MTYTPTAEIVRSHFSASADEYGTRDGIALTMEEAETAFDRWLTETIRQSKEQAWNQGAEAVALLIPEHEWHDRGLRLPTNPHRSQP